LNARLIVAFAAVYIAWGSTYLAIRFAIETIPPLLMAAARHLAAGAMLYVALRATKVPNPNLRQWWGATIVGTFLLLGGNGLVVLAEQWVPSGITALLVGTTPFWMTMLAWLWQGEKRPGAWTITGLAVGFAGLYLLVNPTGATGERVHAGGALLVFAATLCWTIGSLLSRKVAVPASPFMSSAMQMLTGGAILGLVGTAIGEIPRLNVAAISARSAIALAYLVVFGSIIGYSAYIYVLKHARPALASTYAYVNPIIAVLLGWLLAGEKMGVEAAIGGAAVVAAVVLLTRGK